jgi:hypothetical protein
MHGRSGPKISTVLANSRRRLRGLLPVKRPRHPDLPRLGRRVRSSASKSAVLQPCTSNDTSTSTSPVPRQIAPLCAALWALHLAAPIDCRRNVRTGEAIDEEALATKLSEP